MDTPTKPIPARFKSVYAMYEPPESNSRNLLKQPHLYQLFGVQDFLGGDPLEGDSGVFIFTQTQNGNKDEIDHQGRLLDAAGEPKPEGTAAGDAYRWVMDSSGTNYRERETAPREFNVQVVGPAVTGKEPVLAMKATSAGTAAASAAVAGAAAAAAAARAVAAAAVTNLQKQQRRRPMVEEIPAPRADAPPPAPAPAWDGGALLTSRLADSDETRAARRARSTTTRRLGASTTSLLVEKEAMAHAARVPPRGAGETSGAASGGADQMSTAHRGGINMPTFTARAPPTDFNDDGFI